MLLPGTCIKNCFWKPTFKFFSSCIKIKKILKQISNPEDVLILLLNFFYRSGYRCWDCDFLSYWVDDPGASPVRGPLSSCLMWLKEKFYRTVITPALLYGTECWAIKRYHAQKMSVADMCMLHWMCDLFLPLCYFSKKFKTKIRFL